MLVKQDRSAEAAETRLEKVNEVSKGIKRYKGQKPSLDNIDERERVVDGS